MKDLNIQYVDTDSLIPYVNNARKHSDEQVSEIAASIKEFGFNNPILIDGKKGIIAGHGRVMAAKKLGLDKVPTIELSHLSDAQRRAYILADNRLAEKAEWDFELVQVELEALKNEDFNIELTGFDLDDVLSNVDAEQVEAEEDEIPEPKPDPVSKVGDVWTLGNHRLMCGDSTVITDVEKLMDGEKADMVLTDPPYGVSIVKSGGKIWGDKPFGTVSGKTPGPLKFGTTTNKYSKSIVAATEYAPIIGDDSTETARENYEIVKEFSSIQVIFGGNYFTDFLPPSRCWFVWDKCQPDGVPFAQCELAWVSKDGNAKMFRHLWAGLCREGDREVELAKRVHPTQKPVGLFTEIIRSFDGVDTVMDCFGGSGTTLIACEQTGCKCRMMELSEHYCDVIIQRWQNLTGKDAVRDDGKTYNELAG